MKYRLNSTPFTLFWLICLSLLTQPTFAVVEFQKEEVKTIKQTINQKRKALKPTSKSSNKERSAPEPVSWAQALDEYMQTMKAYGLIGQDTPTQQEERPAEALNSMVQVKKAFKQHLATDDLKAYVDLGYQIATLRHEPDLSDFSEFNNLKALDELNSPLTFSPTTKKKLQEDENQYLLDVWEMFLESRQGYITPDNQYIPLIYSADALDSWQYSKLSVLAGIPPEKMLSLIEFSKSNLHFLLKNTNRSTSLKAAQEKERYLVANTFSGMNALHTTLFSILHNTEGAAPVKLAALSLAQQEGPNQAFMQGTTAFSQRDTSRFTEKLGMTSLGTGTQGLYRLLQSFNPRARKLVNSPNYNTYYLIDTKGYEQPRRQLLWLGFYGDGLYLGMYPTEGFLLVYEIPPKEQKSFITRFFGVLGMMTTRNTLSVGSVLRMQEAAETIADAPNLFILKETFIKEADETLHWSTKNGLMVNKDNLPQKESAWCCGLGQCCAGLYRYSKQFCNAICNVFKGEDNANESEGNK